MGSAFRIDGKSSIEKEPQTLSLDEMKYAREAALYVMSTHSIEEAVRIFTEGLQPVLGVKNGDVSVTMDLLDPDGGDDDEFDRRIAMDRLLAGLRDTITAPF